MSIDEAVRFALAHHPALRSQAAIELAQGEQVDLARLGYLPQLDLSLQLNRATGNVVRGSFFAQPAVPVSSGPPTGRTLDGGVLSSTAGLSASLDLLGLARRMALTDVALAEQEHVRAGTQVLRLSVAVSAADAFIGLLIAEQTVAAARASVERAHTFATMVRALVDQDLRPGADLSRAEAEMALARTQLSRAEQAQAVQRVQLALALGVPGQAVTASIGNLGEIPKALMQPREARPAPGNPLLLQAAAATRVARTTEHAGCLAYLPRLDLAAALWARGSGYFPGGPDLGGAQGLLPDTPNWAAGLVLTWPLLSLLQVRAQSRIDAARVQLALSRHEEIAQSVRADIESAGAIVKGALQVAGNTKVALLSARSAEQQATARYRAGLAPEIDVADAQRLLAQAEMDDAVAQLGVWRALLLQARSFGDLTAFLDEAQGGPPAGGG